MLTNVDYGVRGRNG